MRRPMRAIARLMGIDEVRNAQKERAMVPDCPNRLLLDGQSYMKRPMREQESSLGFENHHRSSIWGPGPQPTKSDMDRIRRRIDARYLSDCETNEERHRHSRELVRTSGRVDPRDLLRQYVKKRDALFADRQFKPSRSLSTSVLKPSSSAKYVGNAIVCMSERNTTDITYPERIDGPLLELQYRHRVLVSCQTPIQSWRNKSSCDEVEYAGLASGGVRKLAREITSRTIGACDKREGGIYPGENHPKSWGRRKVAMGYPLRKVFFSPRGSQSLRNKCIPCPPLNNREPYSALEASDVNQMQANAGELSEEQKAETDDCNENLVTDAMIDEHGSTRLSSYESSVATHGDFSLHQGLDDGPPGEVSLSLHHLAVPISSGSSKDTDYASPAASTSEVPSAEDASLSPGSFERVHPDLNEAQMQLQPLKRESHPYNEISTLITNKEDVAYPSSSWQSSYMLDVLTESGFDHFSFDMFNIIMWQSPDYPLDPTLFDVLEEKYNDETTGSRPERLLLFHRINSAIVQIFQDLESAGLLATRQKERAKDSLMSLESAHWEVTERILYRDMRWEDRTEEIVLVGSNQHNSDRIVGDGVKTPPASSAYTSIQSVQRKIVSVAAESGRNPPFRKRLRQHGRFCISHILVQCVMQTLKNQYNMYFSGVMQPYQLGNGLGWNMFHTTVPNHICSHSVIYWIYVALFGFARCGLSGKLGTPSCLMGRK